MWPTSGTFTFSAEPEDGYELADGCAPLAVEVVYITFSRREDNSSAFVKSLEWDGTKMSGDYAEFLNENSRIYRDEDAFVLELNDYSPLDNTQLDIRQGKWIIKLNVRGDRSGINIGENATVSIQLDQGGIINAISPYSANASEYNRHGINSSGNLTITSGTVTAKGPYSGLYQNGGTFEITGGTLKTNVRGENDSRRGLYFCR